MTDFQWVKVDLPTFDLWVKLVRVSSSDPTTPVTFEITDFKAPGHPEVDWDWIDSHSPLILQFIPFNG